MAINTLTIAYELQDVLKGLRRCDGKTHGENRLHDQAKKLVEELIAAQPAPEAWHAQYTSGAKFSPSVVGIIDLLVSNRLPVSLHDLVGNKVTDAGDFSAGVRAMRMTLSRANGQIAFFKCPFEIKVSGGMVSTATTTVVTQKKADCKNAL